MKIRLKKGKQRELILISKGILSWREFGIKLNIAPSYLSGDLKREKRLIDSILYNELCRISKSNYDKYIVERLKDNWGKVKGGINSKGSTLRLEKPENCVELAEFVGALLGDGSLNAYREGKKIGTYSLKIAGDINKDKDYHQDYLKKLSEKIFNINTKEIISPRKNERFLVMYSKELVTFFENMGIRPGNKIKNKSTIPRWIYEKKEYLTSCLRGLIDTDGSIFRMSRRNKNLLRISFTNYNLTLLKDARNAFTKLEFNPSKIINNRHFFISRKEDIRKYLKEVGFSNSKHLKRLKSFQSPVV